MLAVAALAADGAVRAAAQGVLERWYEWLVPRATPLAATLLCGAIGYVWLWFRAAQEPASTIELEEAEASDEWSSERTCSEMTLRQAGREGMVQCWDPATFEYLGEVPAMTPAQVEGVVAAARKAQVAWARTSYAERRQVLRRLGATVMRYRDAIVRVSMRDTGKTRVEAYLGEILTTMEKISWMCKEGEYWLQPQSRSVSTLTAAKSARLEYHPMGVIATIAPWNYPFHNFYNHVISGLFAGNAVVAKVSEWASWSGGLYLRLLRQVLRDCGHSPDLVQVVTGFGDAGAALVGCKGVDKIIFTGSPEVGKHIMRGAADNLTPVILELGGKDPAIIMDDVNLKDVLPIILRGSFQNCGQNCIGIERVYVHRGIYDRFVEGAKAVVDGMKQGACLTGRDEVDQGAMTMPTQLDIIQDLVDDAVAKGARVLAGGKPADPRGDGRGQYYPPTLLVDVTHEMRIANKEVFGPVMTVIKVEDDDDVVAKANSTPYGLGSSVFSGSARRAEAIGRRLHTGMTAINDFGVFYLAQSLPFGGVGVSGFGRFGGPEGLRALCIEKTVICDAIPGVKSGGLPPIMQYPVTNKAVPFLRGMMDMAYADSLWGRARGLFALAKGALL